MVDVEYPQTWTAGYKWMITALGAISVLSVTMTSSMMSAAIFEIRKEFPGHTAEMYIMSESSCDGHRALSKAMRCVDCSAMVLRRRRGS